MSEDQRPERATQVAAERRRRDGSSLGHRLKLEVPEKVREKLAAEGRTPRWVNDVDNRVEDFTGKDDYDRVEGVEPRRVGTNDKGEPVFAYLLAKRSDFIAQDREKSDRRRREIEKARFAPDDNAQPFQGHLGAVVKVESASKIERRNQVLDE